MKFHQIYRPLTATPFTCDGHYAEFAPCDALKPYIRCFWGTRRPVEQGMGQAAAQRIVTPDTCMDILFHVNFTDNRITNRFCGIDDRAFYTGDSAAGNSRSGNPDAKRREVFDFAIRFYAWSVPLFAEDSMCGVRNAFFDVGEHFSRIKRALEPLLFDVTDIYEVISVAEGLLLEVLNDRNENGYIMQAVGEILSRRGNLSVRGLARELHISERQMERLFREYVGVSPKSLASMVRYQYLWHDVLYDRCFDMQDKVFQYGYSDQAHLHHDFKKYHTMNVSDARRYAYARAGCGE